MIKTFTRNDLIRFAYRETDLPETVEIESALQNDGGLLKNYKRIRNLRNKVEQAALQPSDEAVNRILQYSRNYSGSAQSTHS